MGQKNEVTDYEPTLPEQVEHPYVTYLWLWSIAVAFGLITGVIARSVIH